MPSASNSLSVIIFVLQCIVNLIVFYLVPTGLFYQCTSVDEAVQSFNALLTTALLSCTHIFRSPPNPPWSNRTLRNLNKDRMKYISRYRLNRSAYNFRLFKYAASAHRLYIRARFDAYSSRLQSRFRSDPASFWRFVRGRRGCNTLPNEIVLDYLTASTPVEICEIFSANFSQMFEPPVSDPNLIEGGLLYTPENLINLSDISVSSETVAQVLFGLKRSFTPGPDGIPASVLINCKDVLAPHLAKIFNLSLSLGVFPALWKSCWTRATAKEWPSVIALATLFGSL